MKTPEEIAEDVIEKCGIVHFSDGDYNFVEVRRAATEAARLGINEGLETAAEAAEPVDDVLASVIRRQKVNS